MEKKFNGFGIPALIFGVLSCVGAFIPLITYFAWLGGVLGIVFGGVGIHKSNVWGNGKGLSVAGLVTGIIGTVIGLVGLIWVGIVIGLSFAAAGATDAIQDATSSTLISVVNLCFLM